MKFAAVIAITLALAMGVSSSLYPLAAHHLAVASPVHVVSSPLVHHAHHAPGSVAVHASAWHPHATVAVHSRHLAAPLALAHIAAAPLAHAHIAAAPLAHAHIAHAHLAPAHGGHYIAKTRGAVHSAPLAGHLASAASINLAPAPGTH